MNTKTTENYIGYESLVSYLIESNNCLSYCRFLSLNQDTIIASLTQLTSSSLTLAKWQSIDITWYKRFLNVAKKLLEPDIFVAVKDKLNTERLRYAKRLQAFWQGIIKEYEKKNLTPAIYNDASSPKETDPTDLSKTSQEQEIIKEYEKKNLISDITNVASFPKKTAVISNVKSPSKETNEVPAGFFKTSQKQEIIKEYEKENFKSFSKKIEILQTDIQSDISLQKETSKVSETSQLNLPKKNIKLINFCYDILHELEDESYANLFYKYAEDIKNKDIKHPMDLFTINSKLENNQYISLEEFENDIHLIFRNCYTYNDINSEVYCSGEALESIFNKKWNEKLIFQNKQIRELKRIRDNDADDTDRSWKKQSQILEQNKDNLIYRQVINDALLVASAYEDLVKNNIIPFIEILKTFLLTRSKISLSSANESMLQAIVESLLPLKYRIPELSLVMDGTKSKGSGRFGYSDIFILKGTGDIYISLELKYISLVGLIKNQKDKFGANELENLDKILEKESEEILLKRSYTYWSKEFKKTNQTTINEILNDGINQLESYMNTISKGEVINYFSSGVFDKRIKIIKSNPNKLKGFVVLVIGFRRILWKPVKEVMSNYIYNTI
ncbi:uncharacterized protein OCT59_025649 [Rhizophagus irregularis]|uniref:Bdf1p n=5 Tax=Rhizophagus irregularis TaxID=588596 RepID=A0A015J9R1_RHIIW|nr:Bdf1p [Rhizophagus irregularis DAOM 197198w]UZO05292.1 hypothetical protein OCT59_025649 [Rhizophagus irregularis]